MHGRQRTALVAAVLAGLLVLAGCGGSSGGAAKASDSAPPVPKVAMLDAVGAGEGQLDLVNWAGYAEDGTNDKTVDWVHPFEKATGCKVNDKI
ncbi:MAG: spermidine/putrescine transporter substrate-binding protein, partial [Frankiales bacterium]|nr:spermidine/putrescine transporter substrate-binding protein [Frankiales bacterium]